MKTAARALFGVLVVTWLGCSSEPPPPPESTGFELRREAFFETTIAGEPRNVYSEAVRVMRGIAPDEPTIQRALDRLTAREDTSDFQLPALLWLLYKYSDSGVLGEEMVANIKGVLLKHKFWPDERLNETEWLPAPDPPESGLYVPTTDSMVYVTENHYIIYASSAYLVGQLYPDEVFEASNETGAQKMETFRPRVMKWLELRYKTGFSEWLSNVYYNEDLPAVVALAELAEDPEIKQLASMVLDLMFADIAINQHQGTFGSTHGRTYEQKFSGFRDSTRSAAALLFGVTNLDDPEAKVSNLPFERDDFQPGNFTATMLALAESYRLPRVIYDIANDTDHEEIENRQRMGIKLEEAERWGLDLDRFEDGMTFMTLESYLHPLTASLWIDMLDAYGWWVHDDYGFLRDFEGLLRAPTVRDPLLEAEERDITRGMRPEVNIYTYRKPHYMLSTAQDWRRGYGGDQQSIWQATLGIEAVAFTTHPGALNFGNPTPSYWAGYGTMPRAIQVKNVVISLYDVDETTAFYVTDQFLWTHAFLPKDQFDETSKEDGWFFARKGDGYLALWSSDPEADWLDAPDPDDQNLGVHEIIACPVGYPEDYAGYEVCQDRQFQADCQDPEDCDSTVWIAELGSADEFADYEAFKAAIKSASLEVDAEALTVEYDSPSQGLLVMAWDGPLTQDDIPVDVGEYPRYENPYSDSPFDEDVISFVHKGRRLKLDYGQLTREYDFLLD